MKFRQGIKLISPKPFQKVGGSFVISGLIPKSWLESELRTDYRISLDLIDINGKTILGSSIYINHPNADGGSIKWFDFSETFQFSQYNTSFIKNSQGLMNIKLSSFLNKRLLKYIPIIVEYFVPDEGISFKNKIKHLRIGKTVEKYERDLKIYYKKLHDNNEKRKKKLYIGNERDTGGQYIQNLQNFGMFDDIFCIFEGEKEFNKGYLFKKEDRADAKLKEKYKKVIEWAGPLCRGMVADMDGFKFLIFSNDHDKHFHVMHSGRGVNARFSFPEIELINYKNKRNSISKKEIKKIKDFFGKEENFKKLADEFARRDEFLNLS